MNGKINFFANRLGEHDHVLKFIGAVLNSSDWGPTLILEFCKRGPLDQWLIQNRRSFDDRVKSLLCHFSEDIASGMQYLASKKIVHNRLGARNILLTSDMIAKVAGFGPTEDYEGDIVNTDAAADRRSDMGADSNTTANVTRGRIPFRWSAPEVLQRMPATGKSDVWSFGVVLWEIFNLGKIPYHGLNSSEIRRMLKEDQHLDKPEFADDVHYEVMLECWNYIPTERPTFTTIHSKLGNHLKKGITSGVYYKARDI